MSGCSNGKPYAVPASPISERKPYGAGAKLPPPPPPPPGRCCCATLRGGSLVAATLFTIIAVASLTLFCLHPAEQEFQNTDKDLVNISYKLFAALSALKILLSVMLLIGILRKRTELIKPWLISYFIVAPVECTTLLTVSFVAMLVAYWSVAASLFVAFICYFAVYGCCLYVVYCYYVSIGEVTIIDI